MREVWVFNHNSQSFLCLASIEHQRWDIRSYHEAEKSSLLATCRPPPSIPSVADDLRFNLLVSVAFFLDRAGLGEKTGELASSSSRGCGLGARGFFVLGSLEGCVGYGRAKK